MSGTGPTSFVALILAVGLALPALATAEEGVDRPTVHDRFAPKEGRLFAHVAATALVRDDFYDTGGYGGDLGYFFNENWSVELRAFNYHSRLSEAADVLREEHSYVPDIRAPDALFAAGGRLSWGYGKLLTPGPFVIHFDPQIAVHAGVTLAEERFVPTAAAGIGFLTHWQHGIQIKLDLQATVHVERRNRGMIPAIGFMPVLGIGWSPTGEESR